MEDWISLSSGYHNFILKDTLYREQVGRVWKWVILICLGSKPFLTCLQLFFSIHQRLSTISSPTLTWSSIPLLFSPVLKIERKHAGNGSFDSKGSGWWRKGDVEVPFKSLTFILSSSLGSNSLKKDSTPPPQGIPWNKWISRWWMNLSFSLGEGGGGE